MNRTFLGIGLLLGLSFRCGAASEPVGMFEGHEDIGHTLHPGAVEYNQEQRTYAVAGSGENVWFAADAFHYAWKKVSGDISISAGIAFVGTGVNPHRKAMLMIRQSLKPDAAYADVAVHGSGLTSLQSRMQDGDNTHEIQANVTAAPKRVRIEKRGKFVYLWIGENDGAMRFAGGSTRIEFAEPFYIGIGVSAHDAQTVERAVFSDVTIQPIAPAATQPKLYSTLETITVASTDRRVVSVFEGKVEAPNWSRDGRSLIYNQDGHLHQMLFEGAGSKEIATGAATRINNDHGLSPDGTEIAISDGSQGAHQSLIYIVPAGGGEPRRITERGPSYWHGWSPDGKTLAFCGERNGEFDIYTIPAAGGEELRLTTAKGLDDGPEYSPDGQFLYFNSERTGRMQLWRMHPDGSAQEQLTTDEANNWFPHLSPDGQRLVYLTYDKNVTGHPANQDVMLRLMVFGTRQTSVLARLFGGQGTVNVNSWSPDSKRLAFVSYQLLP